MSLDFPSSPSVNDTHTHNGKKWLFNGSGWQTQNAGLEYVGYYNTGNFAEMVTTIACPKSLGAENILMSVGPIDVVAGDILFVNAECEYTNDNNYEAVIAQQLILANSATATTGYEITEKNGTNVDLPIHHATLNSGGGIEVPATGKYWVHLIGNSASTASSGSDFLTIETDSGRIAILHLRPPARGTYSAQGTFFDGSNDYLTLGSTPRSLVDGKLGLVSFWVKFDATKDGASNYICATETTTVRFSIFKNASNKICVSGRNSAGTEILFLESTTAYTAASGWVHVLASWSLSANTGQLYINGVNDLNAGTKVTTNSTIDYTRGGFYVGALADGSGKLAGDLAELYLHLNPFQHYDISNASLRSFFRTAGGKPEYIGQNGALSKGTAVTSSAPIVYLAGGSADFQYNRGKGSGFSVVGALTDSATSPST